MIRPPGDRLFFLRNSVEIERVKRDGRRLQTPLFNLVSCPAKSLATQPTRIGVIVGKRLGAAVARNRAKRIFRELARHCRPQLVAGHDVLIFPRREALKVRYAQLRDAWVEALRRKQLLKPESDLLCDASVSV
ncbi:MAG: ribonuclease P protein component [Nitrospirae bacterium]|nr:ribonuclease P protein component [Nitrospirota bacterium]